MPGGERTCSLNYAHPCFCNQVATLFVFNEADRESISRMNAKIRIGFIQKLPPEPFTILQYLFQANPHDFGDMLLVI